MTSRTWEPGRHWISRAVRRSVCRALLFLSAPWLVHAGSYCRLTGMVIDPSYRAVPNAQVVVRNLATIVERTSTTNSEGIFEIPVLPAGIYRLQVKAPGFSTVHDGSAHHGGCADS